MKEIEQTQPEPTEQHAQQQIKKGERFKYRVSLKGGHKIWEINIITGKVKEAEYNDANVDFTSGKAVKKLIEQEDCVYIPALNKKNAKRKFDLAVSRARNKRKK